MQPRQEKYLNETRASFLCIGNIFSMLNQTPVEEPAENVVFVSKMKIQKIVLFRLPV